MKLTLDFNCIIALERNEDSSIHLRKILKLHEQSLVNVYVPAISGNEKQKNGEYSDSLTQFAFRLRNLSSRNIEILKPLAYIGMCFLDHCVFSSDELVQLDMQIHNILFPEIPFHWEDFAEKHGLNRDEPSPRWINARCDVISMWCNIYYKNDIFITNDRNFFRQRKLHQLQDLGAHQVMKPEDAITYLGKFLLLR